MTNRINLFKNNGIIGWFQYSKTFEEKRKEDELPKHNGYVGSFAHHISNVSIEKYDYDLPMHKLMLYFRTIHTVPTFRRSVGTQTVGDDFIIVVK